MSLTLLEASKQVSGDVHRAAIIELFAQSSDLLRVLPFDDVPGGALRYEQEGTLPGIAFRGVNEAFTESVGVINPQVEPLMIAGGDIDVDVTLVKTRGPSVRATHTSMKIKALAQQMHFTFVKGDSSTSPREFDGLQARLTGAQVVSNSAAANGAALSIANLDSTIDAVDSPTHLLMTKQMRRRLTVASRTTSVGGDLNWARNEFGQQIAVYNDLPILEADASSIAASFAALGANEAYTGGGTADGTSIYVLSLRDGMLVGIQNGVMDVRDLGEIDTKPVLRTRVEWLASIALLHPRAAARLRDIDPALAAVA